MTGQSKFHSVIESIINILIGFGFGFMGQILIYPLYGMEVSIATNIQISIWFTAISFLRSYLIRRWFNKIMIKIWREKCQD